MVMTDREALTLSREFAHSVAEWKCTNSVKEDANTLLLPHYPSRRILQHAIVAAMASANAALLCISLISNLSAI